MVFIETGLFIRSITGWVTDDELRDLQQVLVDNPGAGSLIRGGGGIRKIRMPAQGHGKSGGARVIYLFKKVNDQIFLLLAYPKSVKDTLSAHETKVLRDLAKRLMHS